MKTLPKKLGTVSYTVYILRTSQNTLYIGQTNNLLNRLKQHTSKSSASAKYLRRFESFQLVYTEIYKTRKEAMQREFALKQWEKPRKEKLIFEAKKPKFP